MNVMVLKCSGCGKLQAPPAYFCKSCKSDKLESIEILGKGKLYTYSTVYVPLSNLEKDAPYTVGIVELDDGCRVTGRIMKSSASKLSIGATVELVDFRDRIYFFDIAE